MLSTAVPDEYENEYPAHQIWNGHQVENCIIESQRLGAAAFYRSFSRSFTHSTLRIGIETDEHQPKHKNKYDIKTLH